MRLLNTQSITLEEFIGSVPSYAILSHTWGNDEVTYQDIQDLEKARQKEGFAKIEGACSLASSQGYEYIWIDTCCIDKSSSAELSEAINSMFNYYRESLICYVYLSDVSKSSFDQNNIQTRWCTRGWTLQELLAPIEVYFFDQEWQYLGTRQSLAVALSKATEIDVGTLLEDYIQLEQKSIACRMSWMSCRETTRVEDMAYSLLGIFDINLPLLYGEGMKAFKRLQEEIMKHSNDQSLLAWGFDGLVVRGSSYICNGLVADPLADSPSDFHGCSGISAIVMSEPHENITDYISDSILSEDFLRSDPTTHVYGMNGLGLQVRLPVVAIGNLGTFGLLACQLRDRERFCIGIRLERLLYHNTRYCLRLTTQTTEKDSIGNGGNLRAGITLIPIEEAIRAETETILIQRKNPKHGAVARSTFERTDIINHRFVALSFTVERERFLGRPVLVLPADAKLDSKKHSILLPTEQARNWAILVYLVQGRWSFERRLVSVISILINVRSGLVSIIEVHPPSYLDAESGREKWLTWAESAGIEKYAYYSSPSPCYWSRLQNIPDRVFVATLKKRTIYNHSAFFLDLDLKYTADWSGKLPFLKAGKYLRDSVLMEKVFDDAPANKETSHRDVRMIH